MKKMDSLGLKMCSFQAELFERSLNETDCSSKIFIRRFMNSNLAKRMDNDGFVFDATTVADAINELENQYGKSEYGKEKFGQEELHWIGYIYRYWSYITERPSNQLYKTVKPEYLRKLYFPYHSLDPYQAIERMSEELGMNLEEDMYDIARGVVILRKVRSKGNNRRVR